MVWIWGLMAAAAAVLNEWVVREWPDHTFLWYYGHVGFWSQPIIALGIYRIMADSSSLVSGVITFTIATASIRLFAQTVLLNETVSWPSWAAYGLILGAALLKLFWRA